MPGVNAVASVHLYDPAGTGALSNVAAQNDVTGAIAHAWLPFINPEAPAAPAAPHCAIGAIVIARGDSHYGGNVFDGNGVLIRALRPYELACFIADETHAWLYVGNKIPFGITPGPPAGLTSSTVPKWWVPDMAPDGSVMWYQAFE